MPSIPRCTVQRRGGDFCDAPAAEDMPFPICTRHAVELYRHMRQIVEDATSTHEGRLAVGGAVLHGIHDEKRKRESLGVVYSIRVGTMIKIGYTENLMTRVSAYPPGRKLLATEEGGKILETRRHRQFAALRTAGKEWFSIEQPLIDHINQLRHALHQPPLTLTQVQNRM